MPAASASDTNAAMFNVGYYLSVQRGAIRERKK
jgi:hypothetical protein